MHCASERGGIDNEPFPSGPCGSLATMGRNQIGLLGVRFDSGFTRMNSLFTPPRIELLDTLHLASSTSTAASISTST